MLWQQVRVAWAVTLDRQAVTHRVHVLYLLGMVLWVGWAASLPSSRGWERRHLGVIRCRMPKISHRSPTPPILSRCPCKTSPFQSLPAPINFLGHVIDANETRRSHEAMYVMLCMGPAIGATSGGQRLSICPYFSLWCNDCQHQEGYAGGHSFNFSRVVECPGRGYEYQTRRNVREAAHQDQLSSLV
jgi:hypothetical protein